MRTHATGPPFTARHSQDHASVGARGAWLLAVAGWVGLVVGTGLPVRVVGSCALLAVAALAGLGREPRLLLPAFLLLGLARGGAEGALLGARLAGRPAVPGFVRVVAVVAEPARRSGDTPVADVELIAASPRWPDRARVRLRFPAGSAADWGDTVRALVRLDTLSAARVPGGYDARAAARASHRLASGRAYSMAVAPDRAARTIPRRMAMRLRRAAESVLARALSPAARELAQPLLFGDRDGIDPDTDSALRASGLVHLLALSGLHVTWLAVVARSAAALFTRRLAVRALAGACSAIAYALVAGPLPSLARAVANELVVTLARACSRALDPLHALAVAVLGLLAWQPAWAHDLGFQLSCAATLGLIAAGGGEEPGRAPEWPEWPCLPPIATARRARGAVARLLQRAGRAGWSAVHAVVRRLAPPLMLAARATLGAQMVALPLLFVRFHALPWTSIVANLAAVPLSEALLAAAGLGVFAEALCPGAGGVWLSAAEVLAAGLHAVTRLFGAWPRALLATGDSPWPVALAVAAALAWVWGANGDRAVDTRLRRAARQLSARRLARWCAVLALGLALCTPERRPAAGETWVVVLDVGQGDAIAIADREGWWLIDTGPRSAHWDAGEGAVLPFLRWAGVRTLRAVLLTHDDGDHTGGARAVARGMRVQHWWASAPRPRVPGPAARWRAHTAARGDTLPLGPGVRVCWPPRPDDRDDAIAERGDNAASLVLELARANARALFTADADSIVEAALAVAPGLALLKAGHHGSGSSSGAAFVRAVRPERVALSCGLHNAYGHPNAGALARLAANGALLDRTDHDGTLWYVLRAGGVERLDWRTGEPWRARLRVGAACGSARAARAY